MTLLPDPRSHGFPIFLCLEPWMWVWTAVKLGCVYISAGSQGSELNWTHSISFETTLMPGHKNEYTPLLEENEKGLDQHQLERRRSYSNDPLPSRRTLALLVVIEAILLFCITLSFITNALINDAAPAKSDDIYCKYLIYLLLILVVIQAASGCCWIYVHEFTLTSGKGGTCQCRRSGQPARFGELV